MDISRRNALFGFGRIAAGAALAAPGVSVAKTTELPATIERPEQYVQAMRSLGLSPYAAFHRRADGAIFQMGVYEGGKTEEHFLSVWKQYHAAHRMMPVQRAADMPQCQWWRDVWVYLYENGLRVDVTNDDAYPLGIATERYGDDPSAKFKEPAEYLEAMQRIGYRAVAGVYKGQPHGYFEYFAESGDLTARIEYLKICHRVPQNDPTWSKRTARYLFDLGLREAA